ncbi:galactose-3-O-sulfotransferase 3-like [Branchiostoma floridae]|uniref:Galactose-3-O-sulfotransferase 3-like n=1 Tax=Branchiostoma floridae TaxID=7739 RepID=C3XV61_BRAFL|nr:galactose-3-O-sulfotransferase 3-like [Branchiostoma floridae]|eukprot:XP_002611978.1 hypothetical protein BRAFLDRAFT_126428 [Branchiostoma floridae]
MTRLAAHFSCIVCLGTVLVIVCARFLFIQVDESVRVKKAVKELSTFTNSSCSKKTTLVFVKVHKAGGTTVYRLLMTFGLRHHLNFVIPQQTRKNRGHNLGWPRPLKQGQYLPRIPGEPFHILTNHVVYNREALHDVMPNHTVYMAILREPFSHLKSVMNFYDLPSLYKLPKKNTMKSFLSRPKFYEKRWRRHRKDQPFSYTNLMSFDMGIDPSSRLDTEYVRGHIKHLDAEFFLVLILEYLDESLVLLKRYMCWDISDIFYTTMNLMSYDQKIADASEKMRDQHRAWSVADYMLYEHFNRTLWRKIRQEGEDFWRELNTFRDMKTRVQEFCETSGRSKSARTTFEGSPWSKPFVVDFAFCRLLSKPLPLLRNGVRDAHLEKLHQHKIRVQ